MKNQRLEVRQWIRWGFVIFCLLFTIYVSDQVIQVACAQQDRQQMNDRSEWIKAIAVRNDSLDLSLIRGALSQYAEKEKLRIAIYGSDHQLKYSNVSSKSANLPDKWKTFRLTEHSAGYITPIKAGQKTIGYLELEGSRTVIVGLNLLYWFLFLFGVGMLFYRDFLVLSYRNPVRFAARMAENILDGKYNMIASNSERHESVLRLNLAMNRLSESLHEISRSYANQRDSMETLIENIGNGLIFIDGNGRIEYVNQTFKEDFKTDAGHWELADYHEVIPYDEVNVMISEVFRSRERMTRQIQLPIHIERKHFDVSCAPILDKRKKVRGIVVVFHDITGIKKLENMRKDFVANVSHELKTPITSLIGFTETLLDGAKDDKQMEEQFLNIMLHEARRLQSLVKDLLELSKIEREHFTIDWQTVSLSRLLDAVLLIFKEKAREKKIDIRRTRGEEGWALGDPYRIRQIMINLITNAIVYTPEKGTITLSVKEIANYSQFIISDNGIGIEKDQIPRVFERFYRVDKARSRDSGGTGLGLAIVKHLVEVHEGHIDVESEPGNGTTFVISFRKTTPPIG
ncbi:PAS domain-containing protein [Sporolactobacillus shoreae]|uniref:histidine kinase n=1 Tax=Sporolactobacillus shoreae TaxID=1465501 RepID=A0A4Z0GR57_9BACL|nr:ATP-binding protein [Sporolactobacillus shoreae]TGA99274.1 PAS domain-containing protein [Sporolactobacillus shoreae]